jgi:hypothetical protein
MRSKCMVILTTSKKKDQMEIYQSVHFGSEVDNYVYLLTTTYLCIEFENRNESLLEPKFTSATNNTCEQKTW